VSKRRPVRPGECPWTPEQEATLTQLNADRHPDTAIAVEMGLTVHQVQNRRKKLGLKGWSGNASHKPDMAAAVAELVAKVREHFLAGLSGKQSADLLGITRSAVSGYRARNGMRTGKPAPRAKSPRPPRAPAVKTERRGSNGFVKGVVQPPAARGEPVVSDPLVPPVPFFTHRGCKWPVGGSGADMLVCNGRKVPNLPYCESHCCAAYSRWGQAA